MQILEYISNNEKAVEHRVKIGGLSTMVERLNTMFPNDKISVVQLSNIIQYIRTEATKLDLPWGYTLPKFEDNETILQYIKKHSSIVYKYRQIMKTPDTVEQLHKLKKISEDKINISKLLDICKYIKFEELRHEN